MLDDILQQLYDEEVQSVEMQKVAATLDEATDEELSALHTALEGEHMEKGAIGPLGALIGLPFAGAGIGAGMYALKGLGRQGVAPLAERAAMGAGAGGTIGLAMSGLVGIGKLLTAADPSGKTLETAVQLAPALMASGAVGSDIRKVSARIPLSKKLLSSEMRAAIRRSIRSGAHAPKKMAPPQIGRAAASRARKTGKPLTIAKSLKRRANQLAVAAGSTKAWGTSDPAVTRELKSRASTAAKGAKERLRGIMRKIPKARKLKLP